MWRCISGKCMILDNCNISATKEMMENAMGANYNEDDGTVTSA